MRSKYEFLNLDNAKHPEQAELEECDQDYWWLSESVEEKDVCPLKYLTLIDCPIKYVNVSDHPRNQDVDFDMLEMFLAFNVLIMT